MLDEFNMYHSEQMVSTTNSEASQELLFLSSHLEGIAAVNEQVEKLNDQLRCLKGYMSVLLRTSIRDEKFEQAKYLLTNGVTFEYLEGLLDYAAESDAWSCRALEFLVSNGAPSNVSANGQTALHSATMGNNYEKVEYLIGHGFDIFINSKNEYANTPLSSCLHANRERANKRIIMLLVEKGADLNVGKTPEMIEEYFGADFLQSLPTKTTVPIDQTEITLGPVNAAQKIMELEESFQALQTENAKLISTVSELQTDIKDAHEHHEDQLAIAYAQIASLENVVNEQKSILAKVAFIDEVERIVNE